jgi:hypothetical protein
MMPSLRGIIPVRKNNKSDVKFAGFFLSVISTDSITCHVLLKTVLRTEEVAEHVEATNQGNTKCQFLQVW